MKDESRIEVELTIPEDIYNIAQNYVNKNYNGNWDKYIEELVQEDN